MAGGAEVLPRHTGKLPDEQISIIICASERCSKIPDGELMCRQLGWEAATERFIEAAEIKPQQWPSLPAEIVEGTLWGIYRTFTGTLSSHLHMNNLMPPFKIQSSGLCGVMLRHFPHSV